MKLIIRGIAWLLLVTFHVATGQSIEQRIVQFQKKSDSLQQQLQGVAQQVEVLKLERIRRDLLATGLPTPGAGNAVVWHTALALEYDEAFEQARWVAHIIEPDVLTGTVFRSNDFRPDPAIPTGSAVEADYFLKFLQPDSTYKYDGFGFDRGHLAPSADFRWSAKALSESYFYSNMSPQRPEFNRQAWASVEDRVRGYLYSHPTSRLYVVTGPVLRTGLPKIERGVNKVSIPELYWKVAIDPKEKKGIGFVMPNRKITEPAEQFAVTIDSVERLTGYDFFHQLPADIQAAAEGQRLLADWFPQIAKGDVEPVPVEDLKSGQINTAMATGWMDGNKEIAVCGTVVSSRTSRAGNILLNLDKQFPNQVFTVFIRKEFISNFSYDPVTFLKGKSVCVKAKIVSLDGTPAMFIESEDQVEISKQ
jgi:endonuclease G